MNQNEMLQAVADSKQSFNDKPFEHWEQEAEKLVMDALVRAAMNTDAEQSLIGYLARQRLLDIAKAVNPRLLDQTLEQRDACMSGFGTVMISALKQKPIKGE